MSEIQIKNNCDLDVIVMGRAGVDLYANEYQTDIEHVSGFKKFVGGSAANIAVAASRLGAKTGLISCIAEDAFTCYIKNYLSKQGIDTYGISTDNSGSRTSLAITEMKPSNCSVLIYRNNASDLTIKPEDIDEKYIASSKFLVVTGTALSTSPSREATILAMQYARKHNTLVVLDLDYRPYSWRNDIDASIYYKIASNLSDIVIGNREEFNVLETINSNNNTNDDQSAKQLLSGQTQIVIIKAGELGSKVYSNDGRKFECGIFKVKANKPFGAGDSFAGGLIWTLAQGGTLKEGVRNGSAAAAINVSGDSCTEAMPTKEELFAFINARDDFND